MRHLPHTTVEAAARDCLLELQCDYPNGELHLLGHSFGGWIAFAMALRLQARGRNVASLTILDSDPPHVDGLPRLEYTRIEAMLALVELYEQMLQAPLGIEAHDFETRDTRQQLELLHERMVVTGLVPKRSSPDALRGVLACFECALRSRYRPAGVYRGRAMLIVPKTMGDGAGVEESRSFSFSVWQTLAPELLLETAPGNHMTLLQPPNAGVLASLVSRQTMQPAS